MGGSKGVVMWVRRWSRWVGVCAAHVKVPVVAWAGQLMRMRGICMRGRRGKRGARGVIVAVRRWAWQYRAGLPVRVADRGVGEGTTSEAEGRHDRIGRGPSPIGRENVGEMMAMELVVCISESLGVKEVPGVSK